MNALHTWGGVVLGGLLFTIFWMGTLSVFDREIDRWMMPATRLPAAQIRSLDAIVARLDPIIGRSTSWTFVFPTEREPVLRIVHRADGGTLIVRQVNPETGDLLPDPGTLGGSGFFRPLHYNLHIKVLGIGYWLVGLATMGMLALFASGLFVHRKIFADFFTLRRKRQPRRLLLDLHNVSGVLGLPFHFMISLSGLILTFAVYFPWQWQPNMGRDPAILSRELFGMISRPGLGEPSATVSLDGIIQTAERTWQRRGLYMMRVINRGDRNALVEIRRTYADDVSAHLDFIYFDGTTGEVLKSSSARPVMAVQRFVVGLHVIQFDRWTLRSLYFVLGIIGCVGIGTGYLCWVEARRRRHMQLGLSGVRLVEGLAIGATVGIIAASLAFLAANRLLPSDAAWLGADRAALEIGVFYLAWLAAFVHAGWRSQRAWREQSLAVAALAFLAVLLNWLTTGDHLMRSMLESHLWPVGGVDLMLLSVGGIATVIAFLLLQRERAVRCDAP